MSTIIGHGALDATTAAKAAGTYAGHGGLGDRGNVAGSAGRGNLSAGVDVSVTWFTVLATFDAVITDEGTPVIVPVNALCTFRPRLPKGQLLAIATYAGITLQPLTARVFNGALVAINAVDTPGFALIANTGALNVGHGSDGLGNLIYDVSFQRIDEWSTYPSSFAFTAPTTAATTVDLTDPALQLLPYQPPNNSSWSPPPPPGTPIRWTKRQLTRA
jgi:hypothetical protein